MLRRFCKQLLTHNIAIIQMIQTPLAICNVLVCVCECDGSCSAYHTIYGTNAQVIYGIVCCIYGYDGRMDDEGLKCRNLQDKRDGEVNFEYEKCCSSRCCCCVKYSTLDLATQWSRTVLFFFLIF